MRGWEGPVGLLVLIPLQGLFGDLLSIGRIKPDFEFLAIYFSGLLWGSSRGAVTGICLGFIADVLSGGTALVQMESGLLVGLFSGMIRQVLLNLRWFINLVILFVFSLLYSEILFIGVALSSKNPILHFPWEQLFIPKGVYDAFAGSLIFWLLMKRSKNRGLFEERGNLDRPYIAASGKS